MEPTPVTFWIVFEIMLALGAGAAIIVPLIVVSVGIAEGLKKRLNRWINP